MRAKENVIHLLRWLALLLSFVIFLLAHLLVYGVHKLLTTTGLEEFEIKGIGNDT